MSEWISVKDRLPTPDDFCQDRVKAPLIVNVFHIDPRWVREDPSWIQDEGYARKNRDGYSRVLSADYDEEQKIWIVDGEPLNALLQIEDVNVGQKCVTHWMRMPKSPDVVKKPNSEKYQIFPTKGSWIW